MKQQRVPAQSKSTSEMRRQHDTQWNGSKENLLTLLNSATFPSLCVIYILNGTEEGTGQTDGMFVFSLKLSRETRESTREISGS